MNSPYDIPFAASLPILSACNSHRCTTLRRRYERSVSALGPSSLTARLLGSLYAIAVGTDGDADTLRLLQQAEPALRAQGHDAEVHLAFNLAVQGAISWQLSGTPAAAAAAAAKLEEAMHLIRMLHCAVATDVVRVAEHLATAQLHAGSAAEALRTLNGVRTELTESFSTDHECFLAHLDLRAEVLGRLQTRAEPCQEERPICDSLAALLRAAMEPAVNKHDVDNLVRAVMLLEPRSSGIVEALLHLLLDGAKRPGGGTCSA